MNHVIIVELPSLDKDYDDIRYIECARSLPEESTRGKQQYCIIL